MYTPHSTNNEPGSEILFPSILVLALLHLSANGRQIIPVFVVMQNGK